jgi:hypothetical protein
MVPPPSDYSLRLQQIAVQDTECGASVAGGATSDVKNDRLESTQHTLKLVLIEYGIGSTVRQRALEYLGTSQAAWTRYRARKDIVVMRRPIAAQGPDRHLVSRERLGLSSCPGADVPKQLRHFRSSPSRRPSALPLLRPFRNSELFAKEPAVAVVFCRPRSSSNAIERFASTAEIDTTPILFSSTVQVFRSC